MKKNFVLLSALMILLCGIFMTSCEVNPFSAPKDTWFYKSGTGDNSFTYTWGEEGNRKSINFDVYAMYATNTSKLKFKGQTDSDATEVKPGLNVILIPAADTNEADLNALIGSVNNQVGEIAFFYSFGKNAEVSSTSDGTATGTTSLSGAAWTFIYNFNRFESMGSKSMSNTCKTLSTPSSVQNLNWKRVLYNMLGDKLFNE